MKPKKKTTKKSANEKRADKIINESIKTAKRSSLVVDGNEISTGLIKIEPADKTVSFSGTQKECDDKIRDFKKNYSVAIDTYENIGIIVKYKLKLTPR